VKLNEVRNYRRLDWIDWESMEENKARELESQRNKEIARLIKIKAGSNETKEINQ
jgi:hypothetical protein